MISPPLPRTVRSIALPSMLKAAFLCIVFPLMTTTFPSLSVCEESPPPLKLVAFGDSLTAGYLLKNKDSFPSQLQASLTEQGIKVDIINSGVSGDTTADGLERLEWAISQGTKAVILELGANDALRGQPPENAKRNLERIISSLQDRKIEILLAGMRAPKNWGEDYAKAFDKIYPDLARKYDLLLYPFFLEGVALNSSLVLEDGLHPNDKGVAVIVKKILPFVKKLLEQAKARDTGKSQP